jgi:inorganic triphosphatase YgiF
MREIELKLLTDEPPADIIARAKALDPSGAASTVKNLRSIYFDTGTHALKKAGIALRLRRDGRRWLQTVKIGRSQSVGLMQVGEFETPAPGGKISFDAIPDPNVREELVRRIAGMPLVPVCETVIRRTAREIALGSEAVAELAIDVGSIKAGERSAELREVEFELLHGNPRGLFDIAKALFPTGGVRFSRLPKSARGYLLAAEGHIEPPLAPRNARDVPLHEGMTAEQGMRDILRECVDQIAANAEVLRLLDAPEGPHQLRVGLRRLRSVLGIFAPVAGSAELKRLDAEAHWLAQEVGQLRDLDVAAHDMVGVEAADHPDEPCLRQLAEALAKEAKICRGHVRHILTGPRVQSLLFDLLCFAETRGWLVPEDMGQTARLAVSIADMASEALDRRWKKVAKRTRKIETLDVGQRHELRKELKKLRYAIEFFGPLYEPKRVARMIQRLKRLQDVFGGLNDAAMIKSLLVSGVIAAPDDPVMQRAIGWVLGASAARAVFGWAHARDDWRELKDTKLFWR